MAKIDAWRLRWFDRWLKGLNSGVEEEPPLKMFVIGGGSGRKNADGRLDYGGRWREEREWPLARALATDYYLHSDGTLSTARPRGDGTPSTYRFDLEHPVPTISGNLSGLLEVVPMPEGLSPAAPPSMRRRDLAIPDGAHQAERPGGFSCEPPYGPLSERPDVLVFQTPALADDVEVTGPVTVRAWVSSSAADTDFTAKLLDIYPSSDDYPDG